MCKIKVKKYSKLEEKEIYKTDYVLICENNYLKIKDGNIAILDHVNTYYHTSLPSLDLNQEDIVEYGNNKILIEKNDNFFKLNINDNIIYFKNNTFLSENDFLEVEKLLKEKSIKEILKDICVDLSNYVMYMDSADCEEDFNDTLGSLAFFIEEI